jgi:hypothetical protein
MLQSQQSRPEDLVMLKELFRGMMTIDFSQVFEGINLIGIGFASRTHHPVPPPIRLSRICRAVSSADRRRCRARLARHSAGLIRDLP